MSKLDALQIVGEMPTCLPFDEYLFAVAHIALDDDEMWQLLVSIQEKL